MIKRIQVGIECKWSEVKCSDVERTDVFYVKWFCFEVKWSEMSYGEVLGDKINMYIRMTLHWGYWIVFWLFKLLCILCCGCFNSFCNVRLCVCVGFVMCGCVYVWVCVGVGFVMCGCGCVYVWVL